MSTRNGQAKMSKTHDDYGATALPPQDIMAERALLGTMLRFDYEVAPAASAVSAEDFYFLANGLIFKAIVDLMSRGEPADRVAVLAELRRAGHAEIGDGQRQGELYLIGLENDASFSRSAASLARIVKDAATRRAIINAAGKLATLAYDESEGLDTVIDQAQAAIFEAIGKNSARGLEHIGAGMAELLDEVSHRFDNPVDVSGLASGFTDLDKITNGFKPQELIILAGRPGMGKTGELLAMVDMMSVIGRKRGAFFSLEMSKDELIRRLAARRAHVSAQSIQRGDVDPERQAAVLRELARISEAPIYISDKPALTPAEILTECMKQATTTGLDYVMIDYLGLISVPDAGGPVEEMSRAARSCKNLAKELEIPAIVAAQLNRKVEERAVKRPQLADLRQSGEIEEAADLVIFAYRDEYYNPDTTEYPNVGENIIAKHRNGPSGTVDLYWHAELATYRNLQRENIRL